MTLPKVISVNKVRLSEKMEITVCILEDGRRAIPEDDMLKALRFLGLNDVEINQMLKGKQLQL